MREAAPLLTIDKISKTFELGRGGFAGFGRKRVLHALEDVSLTIGKGEILGLVGESGSGKSTLGRVVVGLHRPSSGQIRFARAEAGRPAAVDFGAQMVFQNPLGSLNPRQRVRDIIAEPLIVHRTEQDIPARVADLLNKVGLSPEFGSRRPDQMSGGQAQRVGIARALALRPQLIVCDEPVSALDVSIQAQVLNLFAKIQKDEGCSYLFISHDIPVVERISHRVAIMYLGRIVEIGDGAELFANPAHPYTRALLDSAPKLEARKRNFKPIQGEIPSPIDPPKGCHFHPRCPLAFDRCRVERPEAHEVAPGHLSACHLNG